MREANITREYWYMNSKHIDDKNGELKYLIDYFKGYVQSFKLDIKLGLYIYGVAGSGKTKIVNIVLKSLMQCNVKLKGYFIPFYDLFTAIEEKKQDYDRYSTVIYKCNTCDLLVLDDLFAEYQPSSFAHKEILIDIFKVIDTRIRWKKVTITTSNLSREDVTKISFRIGSRLNELTPNDIESGKDDYRKTMYER